MLTGLTVKPILLNFTKSVAGFPSSIKLLPEDLQVCQRVPWMWLAKLKSEAKSF
jgi:hypothetical protein